MIHVRSKDFYVLTQYKTWLSSWSLSSLESRNYITMPAIFVDVCYVKKNCEKTSYV